MRVVVHCAARILIQLVTVVFALMLAFGIFIQAMAQEQEQLQELEAVLPQLLSKSFKDKTAGAMAVAASEDPRATKILQNMLDGKLFYIKKGKAIVYVEKTEAGYLLTDVLSDQSLGTLEKKKLKKISVNNKLRKALRGLIAEAQLSHPDAAVRADSVKQMFGNASPEAIALLQDRLENESDSEVRDLIQVAIDLDRLKSHPAASSDVLPSLSSRLEPEVRNVVSAVANDVTLRESHPEIVTAATNALANIDSRVAIFKNIETAFFGLSLGSVLVLAAIGLAITFGVMGVINMAHGELIMIGAYTTYSLQQLMPANIGLSLLLSIPLAFVVAGLTGMLIERTIISHLYGRPLETLLATFGVSLVLQQTVRTVFSPLNRSVESPSWLSGTLEINSALSLTFNRLYIIGFCLTIFAVLYFYMKKSNLGLQVRAISQNRQMARAMGIKASRIDMLTFGLGSGIAGIAGVALSQLTNVGPNLGQGYIIDSFLVVVFGGVGNLWGTLVSGFSLGIANKFLEPWSGAVLAKILVLVFIILFIQKYPSGLFPQRGRAAEA